MQIMKLFIQIVYMKNINNLSCKILYLTLVIMTISCNDSTIKYYSTGEVKSKIISVTDSTSYFTEFYRNGNISKEGVLFNDSLYDGEWTEYYSDGTIKWIGEYNKGRRVIGSELDLISWKDNDLELHTDLEHSKYNLNDTCYFRIIINDVHPDYYEICIANKMNKPNIELVNKLTNIEEPLPFYFELKKEYIQYDKSNKPYIEMVIFFLNIDGQLIVGGSNYNSIKLYLKEDIIGN